MDKLGETLLNKRARCWKNPLHHSRVESKKFQLMGVKNGMKFPQAGGGQPRGVEKCVLMSTLVYFKRLPEEFIVKNLS